MAAGDKFGRLSFGMPPASNGDWAWLQQIVKSLKEADPDTGLGGQGMVVMSQGVLFRGQPAQTEAVVRYQPFQFCVDGGRAGEVGVEGGFGVGFVA